MHWLTWYYTACCAVCAREILVNIPHPQVHKVDIKSHNPCCTYTGCVEFKGCNYRCRPNIQPALCPGSLRYGAHGSSGCFSISPNISFSSTDTSPRQVLPSTSPGDSPSSRPPGENPSCPLLCHQHLRFSRFIYFPISFLHLHFPAYVLTMYFSEYFLGFIDR